MKLILSIPTFNEIAAAMEAQGAKVAEGNMLTIEKGTLFVPPIDWRLATVRQNCLAEASKTYINTGNGIIKTAKEMFEFVINGEIITPQETAKLDIKWK